MACLAEVFVDVGSFFLFDFVVRLGANYCCSATSVVLFCMCKCTCREQVIKCK